MNDQEINIAIAEACGWEWRVGIYGNCRGLFHQDDEYLKSYKCTAEQMNDLPISSDCAGRVPDFCNDLNAMHEAENSLGGFNSDLYANILCDLIKAGKIDTYTQKLGAPQLSWHGVFSVANATARQRAEAFLKTVGKWNE